MQGTGATRSVRWGAVLVSVGAILWLVQGTLLLVALPSVAGSFALNPSTPSNGTTETVQATNHSHAWVAENAVNTSLGVFELATLCAVLGCLLFAAGAILLLRRPPQGGDPGRSTGGGGGSSVSSGTRALGVAAAVLVIAFAVCGALAIMALHPQVGQPIGASCGSWGDGCAITNALELWIAGSVLLVVGAEIFTVYCERMAEETRGQVRIHGALFSNYAIVNFVGLAIVPFAVTLGPGNSSFADSLLYASLFAQLFVVPLTGYVAFSWLAIHGFQSALRGPRAAAESSGSGRALLEDEVVVSAGVRSPTVGNPWPTETRTEARTPRGAGASTSDLDPDWAFRLQARVQNLERIVVAQNETIVDLRNLLTRLPADRSEIPLQSRMGSTDRLGRGAEPVRIGSLRSTTPPEAETGYRPAANASAQKGDPEDSSSPTDRVA